MNAPDRPHWTLNSCFVAFRTIWDRLVDLQNRCKTSRTSLKVRAKKSRRNFSQRTHPIHPIGNEPRPSHDISVPAMISMGSSGKVLKELQSNFVIIGSALIEIENNCSCILSTEDTVPSRLIFKSDTTREKGKTLADGYVIKNQEQGQCSSGEIIKPSVFYVGSMQVVIPT